MNEPYVSDGPCPFVFCLETDRHAHPVCHECGAVRYGNMYCRTCKVERRRFTERGDMAVLVAVPS